jgi:hypothetical protein
MNLCRSCEQDFGSVSAFDAHRVGKHSEERRCLHEAELVERGFHRDSRGRWRQALRDADFSRT